MMTKYFLDDNEHTDSLRFLRVNKLNGSSCETYAEMKWLHFRVYTLKPADHNLFPLDINVLCNSKTFTITVRVTRASSTDNPECACGDSTRAQARDMKLSCCNFSFTDESFIIALVLLENNLQIFLTLFFL